MKNEYQAEYEEDEDDSSDKNEETDRSSDNDELLGTFKNNPNLKHITGLLKINRPKINVEKHNYMSEPLYFGDIIYLSFDFIDSKSSYLNKGLIFGDSLSGNKLYGKSITQEIYDESMNKCLFQILPKSNQKNKQVFENLELTKIITNDHKFFRKQLNDYYNKRKEVWLNLEKTFRNYVLFG